MGQTRDSATDQYSAFDRSTWLVLGLTVLGLAVSGAAAADGTATPSPLTPAPAADDPGAADPVDANAGLTLPSATGPVAGAGIATGLVVAVGLFSRFERD